jgi:hypothetical protein
MILLDHVVNVGASAQGDGEMGEIPADAAPLGATRSVHQFPNTKAHTHSDLNR